MCVWFFLRLEWSESAKTSLLMTSADTNEIKINPIVWFRKRSRASIWYNLLKIAPLNCRDRNSFFRREVIFVVCMPTCQCVLRVTVTQSAFFPPSVFVALDPTLHLPQSTRIWTASSVSKSKGSKRSLQPLMLLLPISDNINLFWVFKTSWNAYRELLGFSS